MTNRTHRAQSYNASQPWDFDEMPLGIRQLFSTFDKSSVEFALCVSDYQESFGLKADGMLGPRTLQHMLVNFGGVSSLADSRTLVVSGGRRGVPFEVFKGAAFKARKRGKAPTRIDIHESVTEDPDVLDEDDTTERILRKRGLGVHLMVGPDGSIVQHNDLVLDMPAHVGKYNRTSIGIEVVSPYYRAKPPHWSRVIDAPWAHRGRYALPTHAQCESVWQLVESIFGLSLHGAGSLSVKRTHAGVYADPDYARERVCMGRLPKRLAARSDGVFAHGYTDHADGFFPALYVALRMRDNVPAEAYARSIELATGARSYVRI